MTDQIEKVICIPKSPYFPALCLYFHTALIRMIKEPVEISIHIGFRWKKTLVQFYIQDSLLSCVRNLILFLYILTLISHFKPTLCQHLMAFAKLFLRNEDILISRYTAVRFRIQISADKALHSNRIDFLFVQAFHQTQETLRLQCLQRNQLNRFPFVIRHQLRISFSCCKAAINCFIY